MNKLYDVIIAGAGPVGLFLACELALARVSVLVLERDLKQESPWKVMPLGMRSLNTLSIESFYRRGLLNKFYESDERPMFGGHFGGIMLNAKKLDLTRLKYRLPGPALAPGSITIERVETVLTERAQSLGVTILRGNGVTKITAEDDDGVTVEAGETPSIFRSKWLVGCDGARSVVRKAAKFDLAGTEPKFTGYAVKCEWDHPEKLKPGFHHTKNGLYILAGTQAMYMTDFDGGDFDRTSEITQEHIQAVFERLSGITDIKITKLHLASCFTDRCKQATSYRKGRVLLAGDAAHFHGPVRSQGLNLGLGDAINLGWKLAATIRHHSSSGVLNLSLLDTYERERHPIGAMVLDWTRAQVAMLQPDPFSAAIQGLIRDLIATTDGTNMLIKRQWGLSQRYDFGAEAHPLLGYSVPDFELQDGSRLGRMLDGTQGLLVDLNDNAALKELVVHEEFNASAVEYVSMDVKESCGLSAVLVRPDGIVVWAMDAGAELDVDAAKAALDKWFKI